MHLLKSLMLLGFTLAITACSSQSYRQHPPQVSLTNLQLSSATLMATEFLANVEIQNQSQDSIRVSGARYKLRVNDTDLGTAVSNASFVVPALATRSQEVVFKLSHLSLAMGAEEILSATQMKYDVEGVLFLSPRGELDVNNSGVISVPGRVLR